MRNYDDGPTRNMSSPYKGFMLKHTHLLARHLPSSNLCGLARMSTFTLPDSDVSVKLVDDLSKEQLLEFPAFTVFTRLSLPFSLRAFSALLI